MKHFAENHLLNLAIIESLGTSIGCKGTHYECGPGLGPVDYEAWSQAEMDAWLFVSDSDLEGFLNREGLPEGYEQLEELRTLVTRAEAVQAHGDDELTLKFSKALTLQERMILLGFWYHRDWAREKLGPIYPKPTAPIVIPPADDSLRSENSLRREKSNPSNN